MNKLSRLQKRKANRKKKLQRAERGISRQTSYFKQTGSMGHLKEARKWKKIKQRHLKAIAKLDKLIKKQRDKIRKKKMSKWGGGQYIVDKYVLPVADKYGISPTSTKRWETYGNPSSDHYMLNKDAYAIDFATDSNYEFGKAIGKALGVNYAGSSDDYKEFYTTIDGMTFRVQIICGTHGTGPHTHLGLKRS